MNLSLNSVIAASYPLGTAGGVKGYFSSRYLAMAKDSATTTLFSESWIAGTVYLGDPSGFRVVGFPPIDFSVGSISGNSSHLV